MTSEKVRPTPSIEAKSRRRVRRKVAVRAGQPENSEKAQEPKMQEELKREKAERGKGSPA
jgi:hypothetical protein